MDESGNVNINRLLDGKTLLSLDKYYPKDSATIATQEKHSADAVMRSPAVVAEDLNYVMPLGRVIGINLISWHSVDEFYVHLKEQQTSFAEFQKSVQVVPKIPITFRVAPGFLVLTPNAGTGQHYRAEVYDYNEKLHKYKVFFVDLGVRAIVPADQLFENPFLLTQVPKFSHKCCLVDREKLGPGLRDPEAMKRIGAIIQGAVNLTCNVKERLKDDLNVIQMTIDGRDWLQLICEKEKVPTNGALSPRGGEKVAANANECLANNCAADGAPGGSKVNPEILKNQKLWINPVDFLSKDVFRFSIKDVKGSGVVGDLLKGALEKGAVQLGTFMAVEVVRVTNQM